MLNNVLIPKEVLEAEVIFVSHSGGKDSQAMLAHLVKLGLKDKCVVVHADMGDMEWEPMHNWIESISFGLPVNVVKSDMDFFSMVRKYQRLPSGQNQFCTDFLKLQPIAAFIHEYMTKHGLTKAINATGVRADESPSRKKKIEAKMLKRGDCHSVELSKMTQPKKFKGHVIHDWNPIAMFNNDRVFLTIANAGQVPHKIYSQGFSRLSCVFCVNGRVGEHALAAKMKPELFNRVVELEKEIGRGYRIQTIKGQKFAKFLDGTTGPRIISKEEKEAAALCG